MTNAELYLDYVNNFITVVAFADHHGMSVTEALEVIDAGRTEHEENLRQLEQQTA